MSLGPPTGYAIILNIVFPIFIPNVSNKLGLSGSVLIILPFITLVCIVPKL